MHPRRKRNLNLIIRQIILEKSRLLMNGTTRDSYVSFGLICLGQHKYSEQSSSGRGDTYKQQQLWYQQHGQLFRANFICTVKQDGTLLFLYF